jgi:hypothetical protein
MQKRPVKKSDKKRVPKEKNKGGVHLFMGQGKTESERMEGMVTV